MNSRQRLQIALNHQEPDRLPFDLGGMQATGIHVVAYRGLRQALDMPPVEVQMCDVIQQLALPDDDLITLLGVDVRGLYPLNSHNWQVHEEDAGTYWRYLDEWGITHHRPKHHGLYYSLAHPALAGPDISVREIERHRWPNMADPQRIAGLKALASHYRDLGYAITLKDPFAGIFEMAQRIVGVENCLVMMACGDPAMEALFDKLLELKLAFWEMALPELADVVDVVCQVDDYGTQTSQLIAPRMFRDQIKPRLRTLMAHIRRLAPGARLFYHSCGNVRPIIPDLIEIGVEALNPVHINARGMEPGALKRDFGDALAFWGAGVDTQQVLPHGTPREVKEGVRRSIEALAPGGGYVFSTVHNIQADVPPQNIIALWEALQEYGGYA